MTMEVLAAKIRGCLSVCSATALKTVAAVARITHRRRIARCQIARRSMPEAPEPRSIGLLWEGSPRDPRGRSPRVPRWAESVNSTGGLRAWRR